MKVIRDRRRSVELEEFLSRPLFAQLATASEHGPRESPVWFLWGDRRVWIIGSRATDTFPTRSNASRVARSGSWIRPLVRPGATRRAARPRERGSVRCPARRRLLARYLGPHEPAWDARFLRTLEHPDAERAVLVRLTPESVVARGVSYVPSRAPV